MQLWPCGQSLTRRQFGPPHALTLSARHTKKNLHATTMQLLQAKALLLP
jgi:hypothetical protein